MMNHRFAVASVFALAAVMCSAGLWAGQELPEGPGQDVTMSLCSTRCHTIERVVAERRSKAQWAQTIQQMTFEGMTGTDEQFKTVTSYLVIHFGVPVKINTATAKQIDAGLDLLPGQGDAIVKYRDEHGAFADLSALLKVPGLDEKQVTAQKANLVF